MDLKIVGWTDFDSEYPSATISNDDLSEIISILIEEIRKNGYAFSGEKHQYSLTGVPVFNDGTCLRASMRSWGMIMTFAYPEVDGQPTKYMDFYMDCAIEERMPEYCELSVKPADSANHDGMITKQDEEVISQSLQMGMKFMTTDKLLQRIVDSIEGADEE